MSVDNLFDEPVNLLDLPEEVAVAILVQDLGFRSEAEAYEFLAIAGGEVSGDIEDEEVT